MWPQGAYVQLAGCWNTQLELLNTETGHELRNARMR